MSRKEIIKLTGVTKTYIMGEVTVEALKETSLLIYEGELMVILEIGRASCRERV